MRRIAGLALVALFALASTAHAAPPKRVAGVKLSWPSKTVFKPGERVTLGVRSDARRAQIAFLAGREVLARKTLRNGTFRTKVPAGGNKTYTLRATVAGKTYAITIKTAACTGTSGTLTTDARTGRPGSALKLTFTNAGSRCLLMPMSPLAVSWTSADGKAVDLDADGNVRRPDDFRILTPAPPVELAPGRSHTIDAHVPERLADGQYTLRWAGSSVPFTVQQCQGHATPTTTALQLGTSSVPAGGKLPYTLLNAGAGCLATGVAYSLERLQADGSYARVNAQEIFSAVGLMLAPGTTYAGTASIPADALPGTYRLTHESSATFEVTPPLGS